MKAEEKQRVAAAVKARNKRALDRLNAKFDQAYQALVQGHLDAMAQIKEGHWAALARIERLP